MVHRSCYQGKPDTSQYINTLIDVLRLIQSRVDAEQFFFCFSSLFPQICVQNASINSTVMATVP
jgi:hypothetical protein